MNILKSLIMTVLLTGVASAVTHRPDVSTDRLRDFANKHECVVKILGDIPKTKLKSGGSGVVIGPHIVVTAAHVLDNVENSRIIIGDEEYPIMMAVCPTNFSIKKFGTGDIAVCYVEKTLPLKWFVKLYEKSDEVGKVCSISGWGKQGTFDTGHKSTSPERLAGSNRVDEVDRDMLVVSPTKKGESGNTTLECIVSPGDSGGGMFIEGKLAGIHSILFTDMKGAKVTDLTGKWHCKSGSTRISKFKSWIEKTADQLINFHRLTNEINEVLGYDASNIF